MKFGANTFIWESPFSTAAIDLVDKVASMGFDVFEIAVEDPALIDLPVMKAALQRHGLGAIVCGAFGPGRDLSSDDPAVVRACEEYLTWCIDAAAELGSPVVCGPMYASVGKARLLPPSERDAERQRTVQALRKLAAYAGERGIRLAMEPLNRFETDMINIVDQGLSLIDEIGSPYVGLHLDTFHMHLEEKDSAAAIRRAGDRVFHFHACENDRGVPGTGQVNWKAVAGALKDIHYDGAVVIESFTPKVKTIAQAVCIWRPIAPDQDTIASQGLKFLRGILS